MNNPQKTQVTPARPVPTFPQTEEIPVPLVVHHSVSTLAAELLMKVCEALALTPQNYDQHNACGSVCCILGHAKIIAEVGRATCYECEEAFGMTRDQIDKIYRYTRWPSSHYIPGANPSHTQAIARIEHFLRTGE